MRGILPKASWTAYTVRKKKKERKNTEVKKLTL
jgi:hypothetical protein